MGHRFKGTPRRSPGVAVGRTGPWAFIRRLPWYRFAAGAPPGGAGLRAGVGLRAFRLRVFLPEVGGDLLLRRLPGGVGPVFLLPPGAGGTPPAPLAPLAVFP